MICVRHVGGLSTDDVRICRCVRLGREPGFRHPDLTQLRAAFFGGAPMTEPTVAALRERLPRLKLFNIYGMTETARDHHRAARQRVRRQTRLSGTALPGADIRVARENDSDAPKASGAHVPAGELLVRGPMVTSGYWRDAAATAAAITDGWLRTGDRARVDTDGYVYVLGRMDDMINRGG